ncbi:Outer membrane protein nosa precursor [Granulibacter bethesdensis]|nr:Outer membrane protein nosa precursor [Granulibacter bethesdensis]
MAVRLCTRPSCPCLKATRRSCAHLFKHQVRIFHMIRHLQGRAGRAALLASGTILAGNMHAAGWLFSPAWAQGAISAPNAAAGSTSLPTLRVLGDSPLSLIEEPLDKTTVSQTMMDRNRLNSPDTAELFKGVAGVSFYQAGRVSALPVINGMNDDRVATEVDGVRISAACPNHMNPALSYVDPGMVKTASVIAGITPVSAGGDSIAGTVSVERADPIFSKDKSILATGHVTASYRSNGNTVGTSGAVTVANDTVSLRYEGSWSQAGNYEGGGDAGIVRSTKYQSFNHAVTLGLKRDNHRLTLAAGQQDIPYEGFPNQFMDMTNNRSTFVNGHYEGDFSWGELDVRGYWQRITHVMNMLDDKGGHSATTGMPMNSDSRLAGYAIKATIPLGSWNTLRLGSSFDHQGLNDWWPPLMGSMMMGPDTYHNINNGHRDRLGHFAEWESRWTNRFSSLLGFRNDIVMMNTGEVSPYSSGGMMMGMGGMMGGMSNPDAAAAKAFNAMYRGRTDVNFDVTALGRYRVSDMISLEGGYARKTRSPNLYERYAWGRSAMTSQMIGWFGDGNGYIGNPDLKPEIAHTISTTVLFRDPEQERWKISIQPFYTYVEGFINANLLKSLSSDFNQLQFANHNAQLYGVNVSGSARLWHSARWGHGELGGTLSYVRGEDLETRHSLYHMMPINGLIGLYETRGNWSGRAEATFVNSKTIIDPTRNEPRTPGYALFGLGAGYSWRNVKVEGGIENMFDQKYYLPLGGLSLGDFDDTGVLRALPGLGRSYNLSMTVSF